MPDFPVVIVGGGVAGLGLANALISRGIKSLVLEKTAAPGLIDRGDVLHRSTIRIFEKWNVASSLERRQALRIHHFHILDETGSTLLAMDLSRELHPPAELVVLRHPDIQRMLEESATDRGAVVQRSAACTDLILEDDRVVGVRTGAGDVTAALTVLATGAGSSLRNRAFPRMQRYEYPAVFVNLRCRKLPEYQHSGYYVLGPHGVMMMVPLPGDEMRVGLQIRKDAHNPDSDAEVAQAIHQRLATFPVDRLEIIARITYSLSRNRCIPFWRRGAVVIGDAAHTTHPAGGQGMNLAFQDAECLAQQLEAHGLAPSGSDEACRQYDHIRQSEVRRVLARTHFMGRMALVKNRAWIKFRAAALRLASRSAWFKQRLFERIVEVN